MQLRFAAVVLVAVLLSACDQTPTVSPSAIASIVVTPAATILPSDPATPSPAPTIPLMREEDIARVDVLDERPIAVCDKDPNNPFLGAPEPRIDCYNGIQLGFRALRTRMASVDRLYLHRRPCAALPCTQTELDIVDVVGWLGDEAFSVTITEEPFSLTVPFAGAIVPWPSASSSVPPPVARPPIEGASMEVRRREPYPYCGRDRSVDSDQPFERELEINQCFIDGVLEGRPVEMIFIPDVVQEPVIFRFDGSGLFVGRHVGRGWEKWSCITLDSSVYFGLAC